MKQEVLRNRKKKCFKFQWWPRYV